MVTDITTDTFDAGVRDCDLPVLVDFWAPWCGPCKMILAYLDAIAEQFSGRVKVCKINIEDNQTLANRFKVRTVPTLLLMRGGDIERTAIGAMTKGQLIQLLDDAV
ncbi:MAG: thioredoxin [Pseudomonadota bacterium]